MAYQLARIDVCDHWDVVFRQEMLCALFRTPVTGDGRNLTNDKPFDVGPVRFVVGYVCAVVSDLGISQSDNLAGIGRISENFLISRNRRIENHFPGALFRCTNADSLEDCSVFQGENCLFQLLRLLRLLGRCKDMQPIGGPITLLEHVWLLISTVWTYYLPHFDGIPLLRLSKTRHAMVSS